MPSPETLTLARWLALREPVDAAARSDTLTHEVAERLESTAARGETLRCLDLGTGTGANIRYLRSRIQGVQHWLAVDRDPELFGRTPDRGPAQIERPSGGTGQVDVIALDLDDLQGHPEIFTGRHLVTASALLDLVSPTWLATLAGHCRAARAGVLLAITFDGRSSCVPTDPDDERVRQLFSQHQHRDKGLGGPAAGPEAAAHAVRCFEAEGYQVRAERSDWRLDETHQELQRQLIDGWALAAVETAPSEADRIERWRQRRRAHVEPGRSRLEVGHVDLGAWLPP